MKIPVISPTIRRKEMDAVLSCMVAEKIGPGELNLRLVQQVKESFDIEGCAAVRSPAIALKYALKSLGAETKSGVMLSALAPLWQYSAVEEAGCVPVVLDVAPETALITHDTIDYGIKNGGKILLLHETLGMLPDFAMISSFGIPVIEDISQSAGAYVENAAGTSEGDAADGRKAGSFGSYAILGLEENDILTAGGGAVLMAPVRRDWQVLKKILEDAPSTDILPDINCALGLVQLKERIRNEKIRKDMYDMYIRSLMQSRHKSFVSLPEHAVPAVYSFPVVLENGVRDVKQYAARKEIDVALAFEKTIVSKYENVLDNCVNAKSLLLRTVLFPLYPRLGMTQAAGIAKILATLP